MDFFSVFQFNYIFISKTLHCSALKKVNILAEIKPRKNGWSFISGKGCGTSTPIKFYNTMPLYTSGLTCAMIRPQAPQVLQNLDLFTG